MEVALQGISRKATYLEVERPEMFSSRKITSGSSSVGRAAAFQAAGRGFEPRLPLFVSPRFSWGA